MKLTLFPTTTAATVDPKEIKSYDPKTYNCIRPDSVNAVVDPVSELVAKVSSRKTRGQNIVEISGPSGTGKTTLCLQFLNRLDTKVWTKFVLLRAKDIGTKEFLADYVATMTQPKEAKTVYIVDDKLDQDFWTELFAITDSLYTKIGGNDCLFVILSTGGIVPAIRPGRILDRLTLRPLPAMVAGALVAQKGADPKKVRKEMTIAEVYAIIGESENV